MASLGWHSLPRLWKRAYSGSGAAAHGCWPVWFWQEWTALCGDGDRRGGCDFRQPWFGRVQLRNPSENRGRWPAVLNGNRHPRQGTVRGGDLVVAALAGPFQDLERPEPAGHRRGRTRVQSANHRLTTMQRPPDAAVLQAADCAVVATCAAVRPPRSPGATSNVGLAAHHPLQDRYQGPGWRHGGALQHSR